MSVSCLQLSKVNGFVIFLYTIPEFNVPKTGKIHDFESQGLNS